MWIGGDPPLPVLTSIDPRRRSQTNSRLYPAINRNRSRCNILVNDATLHHEHDAAHSGYVFQRISLEGDDVGLQARRDRADLSGHACLVHVNVAANDHIWRFQGPKGAIAVKVSGVFASNSALALRKAALAGLGITLVPRYSVAEDIASGMLVALLPRYRIAPRPLFAVHPRAASAPQKVLLLVDFLRDWVAARDVN